MSAAKVRPEFGAPILDGMSIRDAAAALGVSKTELGRWRALAEMPEDVFESRIAEQRANCGEVKSSRMLGPVPARGRVDRVLGLISAMSPDELRELYIRIGGAA